jgi:hypothetical protein
VDPKEFKGFFPLELNKSTTFTRRSGAVAFNDTLRVVRSDDVLVKRVENGKENEERHPVFIVVHSSVPFAGDRQTETTMWVSKQLNWPLKYERWATDGVACRFSVATAYEEPPSKPQTAQLSQPQSRAEPTRRSRTKEQTPRSLPAPSPAARVSQPTTPSASTAAPTPAQNPSPAQPPTLPNSVTSSTTSQPQ